MLNALLVAAALAAQVPEVVEEVPAPNWEVFVGVSGGVRPDAMAFGGSGFIGVNRRIFSWLRPELSVGLGLFDGPLDVIIPIRIGARLEWPAESWVKPYLWVAFAHLHEVGWEDAKEHPIDSVLGLSEHGVHHRSGIDTGLGLSFTLRPPGWRVGAKLNVRGTVTSLVAGHGPARYVDLFTTLGLVF